jgi:hypothetical protein
MLSYRANNHLHSSQFQRAPGHSWIPDICCCVHSLIAYHHRCAIFPYKVLQCFYKTFIHRTENQATKDSIATKEIHWLWHSTRYTGLFRKGKKQARHGQGFVSTNNEHGVCIARECWGIGCSAPSRPIEYVQLQYLTLSQGLYINLWLLSGRALNKALALITLGADTVDGVHLLALLERKETSVIAQLIARRA